jgi:hypothetical protein
MDVPNHLTYRFSWESPLGLMEANKHEFQVEGERTWYKFLKHVRNREKEVEWVDGVCDSGFRSVRPEKVVKIRGIVPSKPKAKSMEATRSATTV